jgi:hypothetical protein
VAEAEAALRQRDATAAELDMVAGQQAARAAALEAQEAAVAAAAAAADTAAAEVAAREAAVGQLQERLTAEAEGLQGRVEAWEKQRAAALQEMEVRQLKGWKGMSLQSCRDAGMLPHTVLPGSASAGAIAHLAGSLAATPHPSLLDLNSHGPCPALHPPHAPSRSAPPCCTSVRRLWRPPVLT